MIIERLSIPDVILIKPKKIFDERGYFAEKFRKDILESEINREINFLQENESFSTHGVFRGLHFQKFPSAQAKLISVNYGEILDIAVDIRSTSPTFGKSIQVNISQQGLEQLWVPEGFAHGFLTLSESAIVNYKVNNYYSPKEDGGISILDHSLKIDLPMILSKLKISAKDRNLPLLDRIPKDSFNF